MKMEKKWNAIVQEETIGNDQCNDIAILRLQIKFSICMAMNFRR